MSAQPIKAVVGAWLLLAACDKGAAEEQQLTRSSNKPAVVLVDETMESANSIAEVEPNEDVATPQPLEVGKAMVGTLDGSADVDRYGMKAQFSGLLFASVQGGGDADLVLSLQNSAGEALAKSDRGPAATTEGIPGFGVEAGQDYQLVVEEFVGRKLRTAGGRKGPSGRYQLSWSLAEDAEPGFEREPNAEPAGASEILLGEERRGFVGWNGDQDLWRLPVVDTDVVAPEGVREGLHMVVSAVPGVALRLAVLSDAQDLLAERYAGKGEEVALRNFLPSVGVDSYTIRIAGKSSNPEESYMLRVDTAQLAPGTETEPNDSLDKATLIAAGDATLLVARGEVTGGDTDYFQLATVSYDRILELRLSGPRHADLDISVVSESGAVLAEGLTVGAGIAETLTQIPVGQGLSPLLRIRSKTSKGPAAYEMSLSLVRGTAAPILRPAPDSGPDAE